MATEQDQTLAGRWSMQTLPELDDQQFNQWRELLEERVGIQLTDQRKSFLKTSLGIRMREIGCKGYQEYYDTVVSGARGLVEWYTLVDRLTVQETRFFRDRNSMNLLKDYLMTRNYSERQDLNLWSVGCSTGEEPYSLAMVVHECLNGLDIEVPYGITGTDVSPPALNKAREGRYHQRKLEVLEPRLKEKFFKEDGQHFKIVENIADRVCFARLNVLDLDKAPMSGMDVVYCQNLLIYFRKWRRKEIVNQLVDRLVPGGLMILGMGEVIDWHHPELTRIPNDKTLAFLKRKSEL